MWVWITAFLSFIIPTLMILTIWLMISVQLRSNVGPDLMNEKCSWRRRESNRRMTIIMATLTAGWK